jgi:hypothetical protein
LKKTFDRQNNSLISENNYQDPEFEDNSQRNPYLDFYPLELGQDHNFAWLMQEMSYWDDSPMLILRKVVFFLITSVFVVSSK